DRLDVRPNTVDAIHLNVQVARSSFDAPNTYDQDALGQDQHQKNTTVNVAPGYSRVLSSNMVMTANGYVRADHVVYTPSSDPFADTPGTVAQDRRLTNIGGKVDVSYARAGHNIKFGGMVGGTKLHENFQLGLTDPAANAPCLDTGGAPSGDASLI